MGHSPASSLQVGGGAGEYGRVSFLVRLGEARLLLDYGAKRTPRPGGGWGEYPLYREADLTGLTAVFASHAHEDHLAGLPLLAAAGLRAPVYAQPATIAQAPKTCAAWQRALEAQASAAGYDPAALASLTWTPLDQAASGQRFRSGPTGHVPGACWLKVEYDGGTFLYTGDFACESPLLRGPRFPNAGTILVEASYGTAEIRQADQLEQLLALIRETSDRGGVVLLAVPALGRGQEMLAALWPHQAELPPLVADRAIHANLRAYLDAGEELRPEARPILQDIERSLDARLDEASARDWLAGNGGPAVWLAPDGMLNSGLSSGLLPLLAGEPRHLVVLSGHQAEDSPGWQLLHGARRVRLKAGQPELGVACRVERLAWKAHPDIHDLLSALPDGEGQTIILYGCDLDKANAVAEWLGQRGFRTLAPAPGDRLVI